MIEQPRKEGTTAVHRKRTRGIARRANLPASGEIHGRITIVQEDRFRMEDELGRGYLFILGRKAGVSMDDLNAWREGGSR